MCVTRQTPKSQRRRVLLVGVLTALVQAFEYMRARCQLALSRSYMMLMTGIPGKFRISLRVNADVRKGNLSKLADYLGLWVRITSDFEFGFEDRVCVIITQRSADCSAQCTADLDASLDLIPCIKIWLKLSVISWSFQWKLSFFSARPGPLSDYHECCLTACLNIKIWTFIDLASRDTDACRWDTTVVRDG